MTSFLAPASADAGASPVLECGLYVPLLMCYKEW